MKLKQIIYRFSCIIFVVCCISLIGAGCGGNSNAGLTAPRTLSYWGVWDEPGDIDQLVAAYRARYPYVNIVYTKIPYQEYEKTLFDAWVRGTGPDIFSISNTWINKYAEFIAPMPPLTTMGVKTVAKKYGIKEEITYSIDKNISPIAQNITHDYVDVVSKDVILQNQIYGLPYSIDTLVMFYNKDLLSSATIALPPETWQAFVKDVPRLSIQDSEGKIIQSGTSLGTAKNISRSVDILSLLMIQNGTSMIDPSTGRVSFGHANSDGSYYPGVKALEFFTDFSSPTKEVYSWNDTLPNSLDAFCAGQVAYFFGYSYHIPQIEQKSSINYAITKIPQVTVSNPKNFTNYWVTTVYNKSKYANEAWDFIKYASRPEIIVNFLTSSKKPSALKTIINQQMQDFDLHIFAEQALTAQSWYRGKNAPAMEEAVQEMIDSIINGSAPDASSAINMAEGKIQASY